MRRVYIFREGNMMAAMIGPDLVLGVGGFGPSVSEALDDLAAQIEEHGYQLIPPAVVEVAGKKIEAVGFTASDTLKRLAEKIADYHEEDFPPLNWEQIAREKPV
jgi:hypothetical protein